MKVLTAALHAGILHEKYVCWRGALQFISSCIFKNEVYFLYMYSILLSFLSECSAIKIDVLFLSRFICALFTMTMHS